MGPLVGNRTVQQNLAAMLAGGRLPHAILIAGAQGLGKRTLAAYLAKAAVCTGAEPPCGVCRGCHLADAGSHPDILRIAPEEKRKNISVAQVRQARQEAYLKPHQAARRVFVFEQAETLSEQAQNALLKVLEEPPADAIFLLLAASEQALLETVRSRCVIFSLSPPERAEALAVLREKSPKKPPEALEAALDAAGNNVGRALALLGRKKGDRPESPAEQFLAQVADGTTLDLLLTIQPLEKDRTAAAAFLEELQRCVARELRAACCGEPARLSQSALARLSDALREAADRLSGNGNLPLLLAAFCARCKSGLIS